MLQTSLKSRRYPAKPERPVEITKQASNAEALVILNEFVKEARKEIKQRTELTMKGVLTKNACDSVTFLSDTFSLTIDFNGGLLV